MTTLLQHLIALFHSEGEKIDNVNPYSPSQLFSKHLVNVAEDTGIDEVIQKVTEFALQSWHQKTVPNKESFFKKLKGLGKKPNGLQFNEDFAKLDITG